MEHDNETIDSEGFLLVKNYWYVDFTSGFTGKLKWSDGSKLWYKNGKLHRDDGPAVEWANGTKEWYKNGQQHREDGPAIEYADGSIDWWYNDKHGLENFPPELKKKLARKFIYGA